MGIIEPDVPEGEKSNNKQRLVAILKRCRRDERFGFSKLLRRRTFGPGVGVRCKGLVVTCINQRRQSGREVGTIPYSCSNLFDLHAP